VWTVSDRFSEVAAASHESAVKLEAWSLGVKLGEAIPGGPAVGSAYFSDGSVRDDFVVGVRRSLSLTVPQNNLWLSWLDRPALELRPFTGVSYGNTIEWCPQGRFIVKSRPRSLRPGQLSLKANDFWERVIDADFPGVRSYGGREFELRGIIRQFISETGNYTVIERSTSTAIASLDYVWEGTRMKSITDLCQAIAATAYFNREGVPVVDDWAQGPTVLEISSQLIDLDSTIGWEKVYNTVVAKSSAQGVSFDPVTVSITDPLHPAFRGNLGSDVVKRFSSPLLMDEEQAGEAAYALLWKHSGPARTVTLSIVPNPALDAGDVVLVDWPGGPDILRIQSINHPLGKGPQQITAMPMGATGDD
jgi:hypothetical protein